MLKTFWNGAKGWRDRQIPDGTLVWISPTGHTYTTHPGSTHLFPTLCEPTATLATERRLNENYAATVCAQMNPDESWSAWSGPVPRSNDPPPF